MQRFEQQYYEFDGFWNSEEFNKANRARIEATYKLLPDYVTSLLDVACGNGLFCNYVQLASPSMRVVGLDRSNVALTHVRGEKTQGEISALPFGDGEFDCVSALQVLEHLTLPDLKRAKQEITRVAKDSVIISVPYEQRIEDDYTRCPSCRTIFNSDLHLRTFGDEDVENLFFEEGFVCVKRFEFGKITEYLGRRLYRNFSSREDRYRWNSPICPLCGYSDEEYANKNATGDAKLQKKRRLFRAMTALPRVLWPKRTRYYWIVALYERNIERARSG